MHLCVFRWLKFYMHDCSSCKAFIFYSFSRVEFVSVLCFAHWATTVNHVLWWLHAVSMFETIWRAFTETWGKFLECFLSKSYFHRTGTQIMPRHPVWLCSKPYVSSEERDSGCWVIMGLFPHNVHSCCAVAAYLLTC